MKENLMGYLVLDFHKNGLNNQPVGVIQSTVRFFFWPWLGAKKMPRNPYIPISRDLAEL